MTTPKPVAKCACPDCPNMSRPKSIYCCEKCQQKSARIKAREYNRAYSEAHARKSRKVYAASRQVTIIDPLVATPYEIPHSEFLMFRAHYLPGTRIIMDGQEMTL